ncbi:MAG: hypothetical protein LBR64_00750 [Dysgonamonadaceae bacterium]|jgi:hypothetical protein|nr:hypothetical protein [Dysgonamonadaceae bacterium]
MGLIELKETAPHRWEACYEGRYGRYAIYVNGDGKTFTGQHCTCPDTDEECKHIEIVKAIIAFKNEAEQKKSLYSRLLLYIQKFVFNNFTKEN